MIYPREFLDALNKDVDILTIAEACGFRIHKNGNVYQTECLHAGDDTPSLTFFPETNTFHCFGCGESGDVIRFAAWTQNLTFPQAVERIAQHAGISIDEFSTTGDKTKAVLLEKSMKTNKLYWKTLQKDKEALAYIDSRYITKEDTIQWRIGVVPDGGDKKYSGRLAFAIMDEHSRTVGFGCRSLKGDKPKYINSPESLIFKKSHILYGYNYAKKVIRQYDFAVVVEGYTDVIQLQKYGVPAVGQMGISLSLEQAKLLKRHTSNIILFNDGDGPGQEYTLKNARLLKEEGFNVKAIITLKDPDEVAIEHKENTVEYIKRSAVVIPGYQINIKVAECQTKIDDIILSSLSELLPLLAELPNAAELEHYVSRISTALRVDKSDVYHMLTRGGYYGKARTV